MFTSKLLLLAGILASGSSLVHAEQVSLRADVWFPHNGEPASATPGYMIEIAKEIFGAAGIQVNYENMPWERALQITRAGQNDCVVGAAKGDAPDFIFPDEPQGSDQSFAFVKKGAAWRYSGIASFSSVKLGVVEGYSYTTEVDEYIKANKSSGKVQSVAGETPLEQNMRKLLAGRIDAIVESRPVFLAMAKKLQLDGKFDEAGNVGEPSELYIACSPVKANVKSYGKLLTEGTVKLRASGKLAAILNKYGLQDWK